MPIVQLLLNKDVVEDYHDMPDFLLQKIGAFAPLLQQPLNEPFPLLVADATKLKATKKLMQWLQRDIPLGQLVEEMRDFRSLARCADKYDVPQLLDELTV